MYSVINVSISRVLSILLIVFYLTNSFGQVKTNIIWYNPAKSPIDMIEGKAWSDDNKDNLYSRLPYRAKDTVRKEVWNLSKNSAGLVIRFKTNANNITVKYQTEGGLQMQHMPATGVSGVDLYSVDTSGNQFWIAAGRSMSDTIIIYRYKGINPNNQYINQGMEYRLFLPLYNTVKRLEIGIAEDKSFRFLTKRKLKPIVVYGTSIAQGACASRPGMAWTSILSRKLDIPVINLGFSGEGKLEKEMIELISEIDAQIYILDCLPNMTAPRFTDEEVENKIINAVNFLKSRHPDTPVILVEHDGYSDGEMRPERFKQYNDINKAMRIAFGKMKLKSVKNIYLLTKDNINIDDDCQVDGIHPNDLGMYRYAEAYIKLIKKVILPADEDKEVKY